MKLGISGALARAFITSPLTPLLLLAALMVGASRSPRCRARRIRRSACRWSTFIIQANGYKASDAVELITRPLEDIIKGVNGVEHVYSQTQDDKVVVTARFFVGTDEDTAALRIHEKIRAHIGELPKGIPEPLIVGRGIDDVATVVLTLAAEARSTPTDGRTMASFRSPRSCSTISPRSRMSARAISSAAARTRSASSRTRSAFRSTA